jgi:hypothetical protein
MRDRAAAIWIGHHCASRTLRWLFGLICRGCGGCPRRPSSIHWNWACDTLTQHAAYLSASPVIGQTELGSPPGSVGIATATRVLWRLFPVQADSQVAGSLVRLSVFKSSELEALAITSVSEGHRTLPATLINAFAATL